MLLGLEGSDVGGAIFGLWDLGVVKEALQLRTYDLFLLAMAFMYLLLDMAMVVHRHFGYFGVPSVENVYKKDIMGTPPFLSPL